MNIAQEEDVGIAASQLSSAVPSNAPMAIGLVASPFGFRLWNTEADGFNTDGVVFYVRGDICEGRISDVVERCAQMSDAAGSPFAIHKSTGAMMFRAVTEKISSAIRTLKTPEGRA